MAISKETIEDMVEAGYHLNKNIKDSERKLEIIKKDLKEYAKAKRITNIMGKEHVAVFTKRTTSTVNTRKLYEIMTKMRIRDKFFDCVNVVLKKLEIVLDENTISTMKEVTEDTYGSVSFK